MAAPRKSSSQQLPPKASSRRTTSRSKSTSERVPAPAGPPTGEAPTHVPTHVPSMVDIASLLADGWDCPIPSAVWRAFGVDGGPVELLIESRVDASPAQIARRLASQLAKSAPAETGRRAILTVQPYVIVKVSLRELVCDIVALTSWCDVIEKARRQTARAIIAEVDAVRGGLPSRLTTWTADEQRRFRWLIKMLNLRPMSAADIAATFLAATVWDLVSPPIRGVSVNRAVVPAVLTSRCTVKADAAELLFNVDCRDITWAVIDTGIDGEHDAFARYVGARRESRVLRSFDVPYAVKTMRADNAMALISLSDDQVWQRFALLAERRDVPAMTRDNPDVFDHGTHVRHINVAGEVRRSAQDSRSRRLSSASARPSTWWISRCSTNTVAARSCGFSLRSSSFGG
jgi:hypothetical protein